MALQRVTDATLAGPGLCGGSAPRPVAAVVPHARVPAVRMSFLCAAAATANADVQDEPYTSLEVLPPGQAIKDLKLRLSNRGFNRPPGAGASCLVFGDVDEAARAGLQRLATASGAGGGDWLHIFAPAAAVESVSVRTPAHEFSIGGAAAAAALDAAPAAAAPPLARAAADAAAPPPRPGSPPAVVHLLVHKSARVAWRHVAGSGAFELTISSPSDGAADDTRDLLRKVEDATGVSLQDGQHKVVFGTQVLDAGRPLASYGIQKGSLLKLLPVEPPTCDGPGGESPPADTLPDGSPRLASPLHQLHAHWRRALAGLMEGHAPRLAPAGTGGCYFLQDEEGNPVAVFKPVDEEPLAPHNPKGRAAATPAALATAAAAALAGAGAWALASAAAPLAAAGAAGAAGAAAGGEGAIVGGAAAAAAAAAPVEGLRRGLRPGEGAVREVAAYVLDHGHFSGVPATAMVQLELGGAPAAGAPRAKVGSLQQYVAAEFDCEERGVSEFPPEEVHKIAVLDLRLGNTDRNGANILARRRAAGAGTGDACGSWELVPIDHGGCLPDKFEDLSFEWQWWPQADVPFDAAAREYIASLDADRDAAALAAHGLRVRPECLRVLRVCTMLLQKAAAAGLTAAQIAGIASRQALAPSPLEKMHAAAAAAAASADVPEHDKGAAGGCTGKGGGAAARGGAWEDAYLSRMAALIDEALAAEDYTLEATLGNGGQLLL